MLSFPDLCSCAYSQTSLSPSVSHLLSAEIAQGYKLLNCFVTISFPAGCGCGRYNLGTLLDATVEDFFWQVESLLADCHDRIDCLFVSSGGQEGLPQEGSGGASGQGRLSRGVCASAGRLPSPQPAGSHLRNLLPLTILSFRQSTPHYCC